MILLGLDRTPAMDLIEGTVMAWVEALCANRAWDQARDTPRIRAGFVALMGKTSRWPTPGELLEAMPAIRNDFIPLPHTKAADPERVAALLGDLADWLKVNS